MVKVLWLSRHEMTADQLTDLQNMQPIVADGGAEVLQQNMTYPADAGEASAAIMELAVRLGVEYVAGVFPAHVAIELYRDLGYENNPLFLLCPVAVAAPAKEGEVRGGGFIHSHWELFCSE